MKLQHVKVELFNHVINHDISSSNACKQI